VQFRQIVESQMLQENKRFLSHELLFRLIVFKIRKFRLDIWHMENLHQNIKSWKKLYEQTDHLKSNWSEAKYGLIEFNGHRRA
jgi:hypothetical protein